MKKLMYRIAFWVPTRIIFGMLLTIMFNVIYVVVLHGLLWLFGGDLIGFLSNNLWGVIVWLCTFGIGLASFSTACVGIWLSGLRRKYNEFNTLNK